MNLIPQDLDFATPGLLFPAISLLMLAYTNRFLGLASVARDLASRYRASSEPRLGRQVASLRDRLGLVRHMQAMGALSLLCCTASLAALIFGAQPAAQVAFASALLFMATSLALALIEIHLSIRAIQIELADLDRVITENIAVNCGART